MAAARIIFLLSIILTVNCNQLMAEAYPKSYQVRLSGLQLSELKSLLQTKNPQAARSEFTPLLFNLKLPGLVRSKIKLNQLIKTLKTPTYFASAESFKLAENNIFHFRGRFKNRLEKGKVSASLFYLNNNPVLFISLSAGGRDYRLQINLEQKKRSGRLYRSTNSQRSSLENRCATKVDFSKHYPENIYSSSNQERSATVSESASEFASESASESNREIELRIDADSNWYRIFGSDSHKFLSMFIQEAENIYLDQLNLSFRVVKQTVYTNIAYDSGKLTERLEDYISFLEANDSVNADINHLFTGRTSHEDLAIGIARNTPSACFPSFNNTSLTEFTSLTQTMITFAHELAHNLGAPHDDGNICPINPNTIMYFGSNESSTFSECSKDFISDFVEVASSSCLGLPNSVPDDTGNNLPERPAGEFFPIGPEAEIGFKVKLKDNGVVKLKLSNTSPETDCAYRVFAAVSQKKLAKAKSELKDFFSLGANQDSVNLKFKIPNPLEALATDDKQPKLLIQGELFCGNVIQAPPRATSNVKKINLAKIKSNKKALGKKHWLRKFLKKASKSAGNF